MNEMKTIVKLLMAAALLAAFSSCSKDPVVKIENGYIQGVQSAAKGVSVFKGIPYAEAPVGDLRWRNPQPLSSWGGVRKADKFGPIPMQADLSQMDLYGKEFYADGMPEMSENCLYLNVWAPTKTLKSPSSKLPVALWINGGAFDHGYGSEIEFDGDAWASRGVILVTFNYREGLFGFLAHPLLAGEYDAESRSGNYAIYDQIAALEWVYKNISVFGGDPENITLFGQSAGAKSVQYLLSTPMANEKIAKAIMQSGDGISPELQGREEYFEDVWEQGRRFCEFAGLRSLIQMREISAEDLMAKYEEYKAQGNSITLRPMYDVYAVGESFTTAVTSNHIKDIPYMIGCTTGDGVQTAMNIDQFCAARRYYEAQQPVFEYLFKRKLPGDDAGAFHSSELWYMFGTLDRCWRPFTAADRKLSDEMLDAWTNFCKYGNPCGKEQTDYWKPFTSEDPFRKVFDVE